MTIDSMEFFWSVPDFPVVRSRSFSVRGVAAFSIGSNVLKKAGLLVFKTEAGLGVPRHWNQKNENGFLRTFAVRRVRLAIPRIFGMGSFSVIT
jgi:hypothetical protein